MKSLSTLHLFLEYVSLMRLPVTDYRVLMYLLGKINTDEYVEISQKKISIDLYVGKSNISKSIKSLTDVGILVRNTSGMPGDDKFIKLNNYTKSELKKLISDQKSI